MAAIYLDNNATTFTLPEVVEAMSDCQRSGLANPASAHGPGRDARRRLETARESLATGLGAVVDRMSADRVVFTSGGTEANNLALLGLAGARDGQIVISSLEHPSIAFAADQMVAEGRKVVRLPANREGVTCLESLADILREPTAVVSVMWANNETGVIQPIEQIAELCREMGAPLHSDAVQAVGKLPLRFSDSGLAALTCNAHKVHGPQGVGLLLLAADFVPAPRQFGGFQQAGLRPGTEPVALAVGMQTALELAWNEGNDRVGKLAALRDRLETGVLEQISYAVVVGAAVPRLPHTSCIGFPGMDRQELLLALDMEGVACSSGSACASGSSEPSPALLAMGLPRDVVESALRFSVSILNTEEEIDEAIQRIVRVVRAAKSGS